LVENPLDAAHCKLVLNLGNALLTMVAFHKYRNRELDVLQKISAELWNEGVDVLKRAGFKEAKIPGMPPWLLLRLSKWLPKSIILPIFEKKLKANSINSMAQDLKAGAANTELEDINGYFLNMAESAGVEVPYNRALYTIFKEWKENGDQPLKPSELLSRINSFSKR
jgi:2-dehydropantoate 2-reductase